MIGYDYTMTTLSPVHIGTGESMTPLEYHIADGVIMPDLEKIFVLYPQVADIFSRTLSAKSPNELGRTRLGALINPAYLEDPRARLYSIQKIGKGPYAFSIEKLKKEIDKENGQIKLVIKTVDWKPYIPGSSIKGALKTAWLYNRVAENPELIREVVHAETAQKGDGYLRSKIFQTPSQPFDAGYDLFRVLQVGDCFSPAAGDGLRLSAERVVSANVRVGAQAGAHAQYKPYWVFCETLRSSIDFTGRIGFDDRLISDVRALREIGWSETQRSLSMETLRSSVNRFAADLCDWEIGYFEKIDKGPCDIEEILNSYKTLRTLIANAAEDVMYLSIGHGSGWHKMTIGLLLEKQLSPKDFENFRQRLNLAGRHTEFEYPKSRKLVMESESRASRPFGWVKLAFKKKVQ